MSKRNASKKTNQTRTSYTSWLFAAAFIAPVIAWLVGSWNNPSGWMSFMPIVIPAMMWNLAQYYWPVTLLGIVVLFVLMSHYPDRKKQILSWCVVSLSVILSIFLYHAVSTAREDEFTG